MLQKLLTDMESTGGPFIDEVWTYDAANHGNSAIMNASELSDVCESPKFSGD